jgi:hypothetical protein
LGPEELIEFGIDSHIGGLHEFGDELSYPLDGGGCFAFELCFVGQSVDVDGGVDGCFGETFAFLLLGHYH